MGETAADTAREVAALRAEAERLVDALERRARHALEESEQAAQGLPLLPIAGALAGAVVLGIWLRNWRRAVHLRRERALLPSALMLIGRRGAMRLKPERAPDGSSIWADNTPRPDEPGPLQKTLSAVAASAALAGIDYLSRRMSAAQWGAIQQQEAPPGPTQPATGAQPPEPPPQPTPRQPAPARPT